MKLGSFHSDNKISQFQEKYLLTLNFCLICLGILGRVKISEYYLYAPFCLKVSLFFLDF